MADFIENPISFFQDVGDGKGEREFWYTPRDRTLWIEPDGINKADVTTEGHASMHNGMLPITENSELPLAKFLWQATRPFREHFDIEATGQTSQLPDKAAATAEAQQVQQNNGSQNGGPTVRIPTPTQAQEDPPPEPPGIPNTLYETPIDDQGIPFISVDVDTYVAMKNAPVIENQAIIIGAYQKILAMRLEPNDPIHELVDFLQESAEKLRETYDAD